MRELLSFPSARRPVIGPTSLRRECTAAAARVKGTLRVIVTLRRSSVIAGRRSQSLRARYCRAVSWPQIERTGQGSDGPATGTVATRKSRPIWRGARIVDVSRAPHQGAALLLFSCPRLCLFVPPLPVRDGAGTRREAARGRTEGGGCGRQ